MGLNASEWGRIPHTWILAVDLVGSAQQRHRLWLTAGKATTRPPTIPFHPLNCTFCWKEWRMWMPGVWYWKQEWNS